MIPTRHDTGAWMIFVGDVSYFYFLWYHVGIMFSKIACYINGHIMSCIIYHWYNWTWYMLKYNDYCIEIDLFLYQKSCHALYIIDIIEHDIWWNIMIIVSKLTFSCIEKNPNTDGDPCGDHSALERVDRTRAVQQTRHAQQTISPRRCMHTLRPPK